jgi:5,10-methylene-tetrahydrofolate dehydrogenase/methenyl tetrahydrofolate cyclohydrolase
VLDVGINPVTGADGQIHLVGGVDTEAVAPIARAVTPVPGGIGPVTDVWLIRNTVAAARGAQQAAGGASVRARRISQPGPGPCMS